MIVVVVVVVVVFFINRLEVDPWDSRQDHRSSNGAPGDMKISVVVN